MRKFLEKWLDITEEEVKDIKNKHFEIEPEMVNPEHIRMDMTSFRSSKVVKDQLDAAQRNFEKRSDEKKTCVAC